MSFILCSSNIRKILSCTSVKTIVSLKMGACSKDVTKIKLNNGDEMPAIALGTYLGFDENGVVQSRDHLLRDVILKAIDQGYRHFDTASIYETEGEIGEAINMKIDEGVVKRVDVFITTKLWNTNHERDQVTVSLRKTLLKMGLDYVDLFLMHWPMGLNDDYTYSDVDYLDTWRGLEDAQRLGLTRSIGVSNFNREQIDRILQECSVRPAALQIEVHPQITQQDLVEYAQNQGLVVMGYSPFGSLVKRHGLEMSGPRIDDPILTSIAKKYSKTTPQVVLRWLVDRNIVPVAKTVNSTRLKENIDIFDFKLTQDEILKINNFNEFKRYTLPSFWQNHQYYPFEKVDNPLPNPFVKN
ncbi:aldo-keto reductase AKR2E4-like isoform X1 [Colias croceus]|uniref:aldo-keto reductase AKR2E4-like isoform X1 n=1 Tax=Colias crocea TaxID=72248 RepID=UPI001E27CD8C|nr:aldo-keto reductase AKR2E4-like isoform X1 [Colias croceus]